MTKDTNPCANCKIDFPPELLNYMVMFGQRHLWCPVCALKMRNQIHGLPMNERFGGEQAPTCTTRL